MEYKTSDFWERVNKELRRQGKTQIELCESQGLSASGLRSRISHNATPNIIDAQKIADFLQCSLQWLVSGQEKGDVQELKDALARIRTECNKLLDKKD